MPGHAVVGEASGRRRRAGGSTASRLWIISGLKTLSSKWPDGAAEGDGDVVAHDLGRDHGQRLALGRVDLARHDRGAGLVGRQHQLAEAAARAGAEQADVVGDLRERGGEGLQRAGRAAPPRRAPASAANLLGAGDEGQAGQPRRGGRSPRAAKSGMRVEAGADRGAAERELVEVGEGCVEPLEAVSSWCAQPANSCPRVSGIASMRCVRPILTMSANSSRLGGERVAEAASAGSRWRDDPLRGGDVHRGGEGVVGRLAAVDVVVGVDRVLAAERRRRRARSRGWR